MFKKVLFLYSTDIIGSLVVLRGVEKIEDLCIVKRYYLPTRTSSEEVGKMIAIVKLADLKSSYKIFRPINNCK